MIIGSEWIALLIIGAVLLNPDEVLIFSKFLGRTIKHFKKIFLYLMCHDEQNNSFDGRKKNPFHVAPKGANVQPIKD